MNPSISLVIFGISVCLIPGGLMVAISPDQPSRLPTLGLVPFNPNQRVIEPVAFSAVHASSNTRRFGTKLMLDNTVTDIGFGWYSDRSEFVCYYPGTYFFTFSALSTPSSQAKVSLMKNGQEIVSAWAEGGGYNAGSSTIILNLLKSDRVYLNIQQGMIHDTKLASTGYTTFSGFRIN